MPIRAFLYDSEGPDREIVLNKETFCGLKDTQLLWIDLSHYENQELRDVTAIIGLEGEIVQNLLQKMRRPRLDNYGGFFHVNVAAIQESQNAYTTAELDLIVGVNYVISAHRDEISFLQSFADQVKGDSQIGSLDAPSLLAALLDWHLTEYFRVIERFSNLVDRIEERALSRRSERDLLNQLVGLKRRSAQIRRALTPHREVFAALSRPDFLTMSRSGSAAIFRALNDRLERALEAVDNTRELVTGTFEIFATQTALRTNHTIKLLTLMSVILMPASVIACLMSMNFKARIYDTGEAGFWAVIASILVISIGTVVLARKRNWI